MIVNTIIVIRQVTHFTGAFSYNTASVVFMFFLSAFHYQKKRSTDFIINYFKVEGNINEDVFVSKKQLWLF